MIVCLGTTPTLARTMEFAAVAIDGVNRALAVREYAAGKAINAARAIATLGERVACIAPAGGVTGERLKMVSAEITRDLAFSDVAAVTRLCVTVVDRAAGTSTELIEESGRLEAAEGEQLLSMLSSHVGRAQVIVLSGSLAPGLDVAFYARCVALCRGAGVRTVVDTSGAALRAAIEARPDVVKINAGELAGVEPMVDRDDSTLFAAATNLARRTGGLVVVTRGAASTLAVDAAGADVQRFVIPTPRVSVVSAIGSGDSFAGGFAVGLARGQTIEQSLRLATACASANAMTADAAHFHMADVDRLNASL